MPRENKDNQVSKLDINRVVESVFSSLTEREREVLSRRYGISQETEHTLEEIGQDFGVTRERVRQIESVSIKKIKQTNDFKGAVDAFREIIVSLVRAHGGMMESGHLLSHLGEMLDSDNHGFFTFTLEKLLDSDVESLSKHDQIRNSWKLKECQTDDILCRLEKMEEIIKSKKDTLEEDVLFTEYHKTSEEDDLLRDRSVFRSHLRLARNIGANIFGHWGLSDWSTIRPKRMNDKIYLVLRQIQKPLHFGEIAKRINEIKFDHKVAYPATIHNELILDDKYVLVGRGIYALREWGYKPGVVSDVICEILSESGAMSREEIVDRVLEQRLVGKSTIHLALMNKDRFAKLNDKRYSLAKK
ncbi:MAG: hypothetical protein G01um101418_77 [Parcubacteria group bacterium Gr01-1014_18]|nr:MAG: hypothetical protein Greene041636_77 [Parcubacteria group bacterium Greene0416_36]TSC81583.1 MAG: hypothetical protein G01um101418_77 [Parcubacteria group bacterium Gr01-1014_18]TSC99606.1 MAG: hypothetical protein Greene101420_10 [Parcubacteria group bacterium Greene1014_20]TSD07057.1 MAG: hypothetical protein Greene07142_369 [Parcubacteria group bacterium Greene0714_2]